MTYMLVFSKLKIQIFFHIIFYGILKNVNCSEIEELVRNNIRQNTLILEHKGIDNSKFILIMKYINAHTEICKNIISVDLRNNKINKINTSENLEKPNADTPSEDLKKIKFISFRFNEITEIETGLFLSLLKLEEINFSENKITEIPTGAFKNLPELKKLFLYKNFIKTIEAKVFCNMVKLLVS